MTKVLPQSRRRNPFEYGRELIADELVDRRSELEQLIRSMENRAKLFLIGPRRYGKTSLLATAAARAEREGGVVLRYDAERFDGLDALAQVLLTAAGRRLSTTVEKAGTLLKRFAGALRPTMSYNVQDGEFAVALGARDQPGAKALPIFTDVLDAIERMAAESERQVTVIIDEFQAVVQERGEVAEKQIRATVQQHRHVSYIFAGSATRLLADMTGDPHRAFYNLGARLFLGPVPRDEFATFLSDGFIAAGFRCAEGAVDRILNVAEEVPYSVQRLAHECWEQTRVSDDLTITSDRVDVAVARVVRQEDPAYTQIWNSLAVQQKRALNAVVLQEGRSLMSAGVSQRFKVPTPSMQRALEALEQKGVVRQEESLGAVRYRLQDPLLGHWMRLAQQI